MSRDCILAIASRSYLLTTITQRETVLEKSHDKKTTFNENWFAIVTTIVGMKTLNH